VPLIETLAALAAEELLRARLVRQINVPSPAAGVEWTQTVPGGVIWELLSVKLRLVTSAVVANRQTILQCRDQDDVILRAGSNNVNIPASSTQTVTFENVGATTNLGSVIQGLLPSPPFVLQSGWKVGTLTNGLDAGDQYSLVTLTVREWSEDEVLDICLEIGLHFEQLIDRSNRVPVNWRD
jgi:hypothetical protein